MSPQPRGRGVLLLDYTGQMGNRLALLSHFIAAAEEFGFRVHDFALLMGCDRVFGTVSSFSQMACFLCQKPLHVLQTADQNLDSLEIFKVPILANLLLPA